MCARVRFHSSVWTRCVSAIGLRTCMTTMFVQNTARTLDRLSLCDFKGFLAHGPYTSGFVCVRKYLYWLARRASFRYAKTYGLRNEVHILWTDSPSEMPRLLYTQCSYLTMRQLSLAACTFCALRDLRLRSI